jgi:hypothetical protein
MNMYHSFRCRRRNKHPAPARSLELSVRTVDVTQYENRTVGHGTLVLSFFTHLTTVDMGCV